MAMVALDTHEVVKELKAAGFTDEQAEAVTRVVRNAQDVDLSNLVTKTDLQVGLAETKAEILKWMVSSIGVQTVVIIGAVIALVRMSGKG
jgi:lipoate synthase